MTDRLNFLAIVIAELMFDLFESFAHSFGNEKSGKGNSFYQRTAYVFTLLEFTNNP